MKHAENEYIQAGYHYERATTPASSAARAQAIRVMLEAERIDDHAEARALIERGRQEARQVQA